MLDRSSKIYHLSGMNKLQLEKRAQIIRLLVEGNSLRSCSHIVDVSINTVTKLLVDVGRACIEFHNNTDIGVRSSAYNVMRFGLFVMLNKRM